LSLKATSSPTTSTLLSSPPTRTRRGSCTFVLDLLGFSTNIGCEQWIPMCVSFLSRLPRSRRCRIELIFFVPPDFLHDQWHPLQHPPFKGTQCIGEVRLSSFSFNSASQADNLYSFLTLVPSTSFRLFLHAVPSSPRRLASTPSLRLRLAGRHSSLSKKAEPSTSRSSSFALSFFRCRIYLFRLRCDRYVVIFHSRFRCQPLLPSVWLRLPHLFERQSVRCSTLFGSSSPASLARVVRDE
jgi:hypothetical protein